jgi:hypothetical protein
MLRQLLLAVVLGASFAFAGTGCQSCSSCHDYDSPVADCGNCGCGRTASASNCGACSPCDGTACNCAGGACSSGGSTGGCNCGNRATVESSEYYSSEADQQ